MQWSIQQVARLSGVTSRTLRYYDAIGLLPPTALAPNGYRQYDVHALVRLQRILLLRAMDLPLAEIGRILANDDAEVDALRGHLDRLRAQRDQLDRRIAAVEYTIEGLVRGEDMKAQNMFDGFEHEEHRQEVVERWGEDAWAESDAWWRGLTDEQRADWRLVSERLGRDWAAAAADPDVAPDSAVAQRIAARHIAWLQGIPGTPAATAGGDIVGYVRGLAEMYVADERFAANYGGADGARFVRDALLLAVEGSAVRSAT